jgi:hypothetical protein
VKGNPKICKGFVDGENMEDEVELVKWRLGEKEDERK